MPGPLHFFAVALVDLGIVLMLAGGVSLLWPLKFLGVSSRPRGLAVLVAGALSILVGFALPAPAESIATPATALDRFVPAYQFGERHEIRVAAPPERVYEAIRAVTAGEIALFRTLTTLRRFGRPGPEDILNAPENLPILEVAIRTDFLLLAERPEREVVIGTLVARPPGFALPGEPTPEWFDGLAGPGFAKAVMNFVVEPEGAGTLVTTETRVFATDAATRRRFAAYWRTIYPGSAVIRRMWLRAIRRRAEAAAEVTGSTYPEGRSRAPGPSGRLGAKSG